MGTFQNAMYLQKAWSVAYKNIFAFLLISGIKNILLYGSKQNLVKSYTYIYTRALGTSLQIPSSTG